MKLTKLNRGIISAALIFAITLGLNTPLIGATVSAPEFPSCADQTGPGDWVTSDYGFHHIPGQEATIEGSDDVYYLEGSNYLQCLCPVDQQAQGVQTNWWNITDDELSQEDIDHFLNNGWYLEQGSDWNLYSGTYLAKNVSYVCHETEPTPTPSPTTTPQPTATPTPDDSPKPRCVNLEANPEQGPSGTTVNFFAHVDNPNGGWQEFRFSFDDTSDGQPREWTTTDRNASHRYEKEGTFIATVIARADNGQWYGGDDCMKFIEIDDDSQVLGASDDRELPATGVNLIVILVGLASAGSIGFYLYRRFRLV